jgi:hypothetical protein
VGVSATRKWSDLDPRVRRLIVVASAIEGALKIAALVDLARRPSDGVRGSKARWATAVTLLNSLGAVPIAYFVWGRRKPAAWGPLRHVAQPTLDELLDRLDPEELVVAREVAAALDLDELVADTLREMVR